MLTIPSICPKAARVAATIRWGLAGSARTLLRRPVRDARVIYEALERPAGMASRIAEAREDRHVEMGGHGTLPGPSQNPDREAPQYRLAPAQAASIIRTGRSNEQHQAGLRHELAKRRAAVSATGSGSPAPITPITRRRFRVNSSVSV